MAEAECAEHVGVRAMAAARGARLCEPDPAAGGRGWEQRSGAGVCESRVRETFCDCQSRLCGVGHRGQLARGRRRGEVVEIECRVCHRGWRLWAPEENETGTSGEFGRWGGCWSVAVGRVGCGGKRWIGEGMGGEELG